MLCRAVLATVALSYVICVLLLSGLQKEDLDANTLEKLQRHNVNIYDMDNESLRHECLMKSSDFGKSTTHLDTANDSNDSPILPINKQGINVADIKKSYMTVPENNSTITGFRNLDDDMKLVHYLQKGLDHIKISIDSYSRGNFNIVDDNTNQYEYIEKRPSSQSAVSFWSKLTQKYKDSTTRFENNETTTSNKVKSDFRGYTHPKEYINRIIAEYLASQNAPISLSAQEQQNTDIIAKTIKELLTSKDAFNILDRNEQQKDVTTQGPPRLEEPDYNGYAQPKEIQFINRFIRGYLESQQIPTTTIAQRPDNIDTIAKSIKEILAYKNVQEFPHKTEHKSDLIDFSTLIQTKDSDSKASEKSQYMNIETVARTIKELLNIRAQAVLDKNKTNTDVFEFGKFIQAYERNEKTTEKYRYIPHNPINNDNNQKVDRSQKIQLSPITNFSPEAVDRKKEALHYLDEVLQLHQLNIAKQQVTHEEKEPPKNLNLVRNNKPSSISTDIIKTIAERVKEIVLKDIQKELPRTDAPILPSSSSIALATTQTTVADTTVPRHETNEESRVMKTLTELLKEFKEIKETQKGTTKAPLIMTGNVANRPLNNMFPPVMAGSNPYDIQSAIFNKQIVMNPYNQNSLPTAYTQITNKQQFPQIHKYQTKENRAQSIVIQTHSGEIPPLGIAVSRKPQFINQNIIVTTQNPFQKQKVAEHQRQSIQRLDEQFTDVFDTEKQTNRQKEKPTYADLIRNLRIAEDMKNDFRDAYRDRVENIKNDSHKNRVQKVRNEYKDSYEDRIQKLKERIKYAHQQNKEKARELSHLLSKDLQQDLNRALEPDYRDDIKPTMSLTSHDTMRQQTDNSHQAHPFELDLNEGTLNRPTDLNDQDVGTSDILNRFLSSKQHRTSPLVDLESNKEANRYSAYEKIEQERSHPRYETMKFHEKLEGIPPRYAPNEGDSEVTTNSNRYDAISSREQMPINKYKTRTKLADDNFRNFLHSQQKVNDALEKILAAANSKPTKSPASIQVNDEALVEIV